MVKIDFCYNSIKQIFRFSKSGIIFCIFLKWQGILIVNFSAVLFLLDSYQKKQKKYFWYFWREVLELFIPEKYHFKRKQKFLLSRASWNLGILQLGQFDAHNTQNYGKIVFPVVVLQILSFLFIFHALSLFCISRPLTNL
jgi:hypothetical protein